uniref:Golgi to ER traffic protein 4 n=2 Tax=Zea mays TaxID=4577 RepID=A0A804QKF9_MAIZE
MCLCRAGPGRPTCTTIPHTKSHRPEATRPRRPLHPRVADAATPITHHRCPLSSLLPPVPGLARRGAMSRSLSMRGSMRARRDLPPPEKTIERLESMVDGGNFYEAQQMYKSTSARYIAAQKYSEALDILQSGALVQLKHGQVTCGGELAVLFVDTLITGELPYSEQIFDRIRKMYEAFPRVTVPHFLGDDYDDEGHQLSEAISAAKVRAESCSSFMKAAIRWSAEFGTSRNGSSELHVMLAEYIYSESPETDMTKVSSHFVRGNDPKKFASMLVNFMGKCYPGEDDTAIARGVLMYLSQGNLRDANLLMDEMNEQLKSANSEFPKTDLIQFIKYLLPTTLRQKYKTSTDRDAVFQELLDEIAAKFYNIQRQNPLEGLFSEMFKI